MSRWPEPADRGEVIASGEGQDALTRMIPQAAALRAHGEAFEPWRLGAWATLAGWHCTTAGTTTTTVPNLT